MCVLFVLFVMGVLVVVAGGAVDEVEVQLELHPRTSWSLSLVARSTKH